MEEKRFEVVRILDKRKYYKILDTKKNEYISDRISDKRKAENVCSKLNRMILQGAKR